MAYIKAPIPSEVYHLTQQDKLDDIPVSYTHLDVYKRQP